jgi:hypothetical protein
MGKPELDAGHEIAPGVPGAPAELPSLQTDTPAGELPTVKSPGTPQAELPGDFGQSAFVKEEKKEDVSSDGRKSPVEENQATPKKERD